MSKRAIQEKEIASARWEQKWDVIPALIRTLSSKGGSVSEEHVLYRQLILGETELEKALLIHVQSINVDEEGKIFHPISKGELKIAEEHLSKAYALAKKQEHGKSTHFYTAICLMGKVNFVSGNYEGALRHLDELDIKDIPHDGFLKRDKMVLAEAFALKGLSLEYVAAAQDLPCSFDQVLLCYRVACDLALMVLTEGHQWNSLKRNAEVDSHCVNMGLFLSNAFIRHCQILVMIGHVQDAVNFCRQVLKANETKSTVPTRKRITLELAEMFLTGVSSCNYAAPATELRSRSCSGSDAQHDRFHSSPITSFSHSFTSRLGSKSESLFCPKDELEEAMLLLLLNEAMVLHSLNSADFKTLTKALPLTERTFSLLTLALQRRNQLLLLSESLEKSLKIGSSNIHLLCQFGISLSCAGKYHHSLVVFNHCLELDESNWMVLIQCSRLCINHVSKFQDAFDYSERAIKASRNDLEKASSLLSHSLACSLLADQAYSHENKLTLQQQAIDFANQAHDLDPNDDEICFQLALSEAITQKLISALKNIKKCLALNPFHLHCLHLLVLVLSAQKKFVEALEVVESTLLEYPEDFGLLQTKLKLVEECHGGKQAVAIGQEMLELWSSLYDTDDMANASSLVVPALSTERSQSVARMTRTASDSMLLDATKSLKQMTFASDPPLQEGDEDETASSIPMSVRLERELSDAISGTISSGSIAIETALALLTKIWQMIADVFLNMEDINNAASCIQEAASVFPLSPDVLYLRGKLNRAQGNSTEAKACYESALAILPTHVAALQNLGILQSETGNYVLAEKYLRDTLEHDPSIPAVWHELGVVLDANDEHTEAAICFNISIKLENNCPIIPFTCLPRLLRSGT